MKKGKTLLLIFFMLMTSWLPFDILIGKVHGYLREPVVSVDPATAYVGQEVFVEATIENAGWPSYVACDTQAALILPPEANLVSGDNPTYLGNISCNDPPEVVAWTIVFIQAGSFNLDVSASCYKGNTTDYVETHGYADVIVLHREEHDLAVSLNAPAFVDLGGSFLLKATVFNRGLNNEAGVEMFLLINGSVVQSTTIRELVHGTSYTIDYLWTPTVEAVYNVTAHAPPVTGENITTNNIATKRAHVRSVIGHVVFEEAHLPVYTIGSNPADDVIGGYSEFADYLKLNGYMVSTIDPGTIIDPSVLIPVDALIIVAPKNVYLTSELDAIENWVKSGGNLLLISDWMDFGLQARTIAARFNITLRGDCICDSDDNIGLSVQPYYDDANLLVHTITADVTRIEMYAGDGVTISPEDEIPLIVTDSDGTAYWDSDDSPALSVSVMSAYMGGTVGSGRLVLMTDSNIWDSAYDVDVDGDVDFYDSDNEILALNSINWFLIRYEHELIVFLETPQYPQPDETSLLNAIVYNVGLNNEKNVELQLLINGTMVNSTLIEELPVGSFSTISYPWVPDLEGAYNITAYAPPVPGENIIANNVLSEMVYTRVPLIGDINGDGIVDIFDVVILANAFGTKPGDPNWNQDADLNSDDVVDIFDVVTIATNFGATA